MAVASLGVTNTIMASIRSRRWQFGILRSIGVTRGQLLRLVLAEAMLLGLVGVRSGLAAGALMSLDAQRLQPRSRSATSRRSRSRGTSSGSGRLAIMLIIAIAREPLAGDERRADASRWNYSRRERADRKPRPRLQSDTARR